MLLSNLQKPFYTLGVVLVGLVPISFWQALAEQNPPEGSYLTESSQQIQTIDHQKALSLPGLPPRSVPADTVSKLLAILAEQSPSEK